MDKNVDMSSWSNTSGDCYFYMWRVAVIFGVGWFGFIKWSWVLPWVPHVPEMSWERTLLDKVKAGMDCDWRLECPGVGTLLKVFDFLSVLRSPSSRALKARGQHLLLSNQLERDPGYWKRHFFFCVNSKWLHTGYVKAPPNRGGGGRRIWMRK